MLGRWLNLFWLRRDLRRILGGLSLEDREQIRTSPESELIRFHRGLGMGLRNGFRHGRFLGLLWYCRTAVEGGDEPMSFDALSSMAIHEIWKSLRQGK